MDLKKEFWSKQDYQEYLLYLKSVGTEKYRDFTKKLTPTQYEIIGVTVPIQRKIASEIKKGNALSFLSQAGNTYYEEVFIEGILIASLNEADFKIYFKPFLKKVDNWAICDCFCNSITFLKSDPEKHFPLFLELLKKEEPFTIRIGLITILSHYVEKKYLDRIFSSIDQISSNHYYVNMGEAWLLAEMFVKFPMETESYLEKSKVNDFTMNKTISKIRDSYRVSKEKKEEALKWKRKGKK